MEILEAYDLTGSYRAAAELAGCDHHTVARYVQMRAAGQPPDRRRHRARAIDDFLPKIEELVVRSQGKVRADVIHERIVALGFTGGERTTRRTVAEAKAQFRAGRRRVYRPWVTEPGLWLQYDFGDGPTISGRKTTLFCAWLAWSRFRVVIPIWDKTLPTVAACLDATFRRLGGVPVYVLTDNEKTATIDHVAGIAVRNPEIVEVARHYGTTLRTCLPADPESKGGSEATVRIAKADLLPKEVNLREQYHSFGELESACRQFCTDVNTRVHSSTRRRPVERLAEELQRLHPLPKSPFTAVFGTTRRVNWESTISVEGVRYSVPHTLIDTRVWARFHGEELIVTAVDNDGGAVEVARHRRGQPGSPVLDKVEAAAAGARRIRAKMAEAVDLSKLHSPDAVDRALGTAAMTGRFADRDLISILDYQVTHEHADPVRRSENHTLQPGTAAWSTFGQTPAPASPATTDDESDDA